MPRLAAALGAGMLIFLAAGAHAAEWRLERPATGQDAVLTYGAGEAVSYRFACTRDGVEVTETGVTQLVDMQTVSYGDTIPNCKLLA